MKHEIHFTEELGYETHSGNKIWPVYVLQKTTFYKKKYMKNVAWKVAPGPYLFSRNSL